MGVWTVGESFGTFLAGVVIPANNEQERIGTLLDELLAEPSEGLFEIAVVCNGCTDNTAAEALRRNVTHVVELTTPSKDAALRAGDEIVRTFPRIHIDADVSISARGVRALVAALQRDEVLAAVPRRVLDTAGASWPVRAYHSVWERLPAVREGLFGRGVVAVSRLGAERLVGRPVVLNDDLFVNQAIPPGSRVFVKEAVVVVRSPLRVGHLLGRRARTAAGNRQLQSQSGQGSLLAALRLLGEGPTWWPRVGVFAGVTALARIRGRVAEMSGRGVSWGRDESTRADPQPARGAPSLRARAIRRHLPPRRKS